MKAIWNRIDIWLAANLPEVLNSLQPGSTDQAISETEAFLGVTFPSDIRDSYKIHDGQLSESPGFLGGWEFLSLDNIRDQWNVWKELLDDGAFEGLKSEPNGPIQDDWWDPKWIPLTYDGSGNHHCLDLNPAQGGDLGQIITMWHDDPTRSMVASSFRAWLEQFAHDLEIGEYVYSTEYNALLKKDEL